MIRKTSIVIAAAVGTSLLAAAAMQTEQQQDRQQQRVGESTTLEGRVVDLHHFMTLDETPDLGDPQIAGENFGGPVGLLVEEDRMFGLGEREVLYVVLVEPERERERGNPAPDRDRDKADKDKKKGEKMYKHAQKMTGERVRVSGRAMERNNIRAIVVNTMDKREAAAGSRDRRERDRERSGDPYQ